MLLRKDIQNGISIRSALCNKNIAYYTTPSFTYMYSAVHGSWPVEGFAYLADGPNWVW